jgi:acyl-CoA synthetase (AMP-forming)/AMP-acid ligase II
VQAPSPIASLLARATAEHSTQPALAYDDATLTFHRLWEITASLVQALAVQPGQRVMVVAPNAPALVAGLFASWQAGAVAVPLSARLRRFELARAFADAQPAAAVSVQAHGSFALAGEIEALARRTPTLGVRVVVDELGEVTAVSRSRPGEAAEPLSAEVAAILYTSGTTGEPKGALVPHALAAGEARNMAELLSEDAGAPYGLAVPASHAFGLGCLLAGISAGAAAVLVDRTASIEPLARALERHAARVVHGSPALFRRLLRAGARLAVRTGFTAGSWCPPELLEALDDHGIRALNLYGMAELGAVTSCRLDDPSQTRHRTVGRPLAGYDVRIASAGDSTAPAGEVQVRSDYLPAGYHRRPWGVDELDDGVWFRTGDLGTLDAGGNVTIAGRAKQVVHVGGFNVFPAEVEGFLMTHPAIAQAAVIGVPHPVLGEALQAFVVPGAGSAIDARELTRFARAGIAGYKVPYAVRILDELPLLPSGKPDRRALALAAEREEAVQR